MRNKTFWDTKLKPGKNEKQFSLQIKDDFSRFGNVFGPEEVISMYVDGLAAAINSLVQRFRDTNKECTNIKVVHQAKSEGDAFRARGALPSRGSIQRTTRVRQT